MVTTSGERPISVWSKKLAPGTHLQSEAADDVAAAKFSCIKATAVIQAPPQTVYKLFLDNSRVRTHALCNAFLFELWSKMVISASFSGFEVILG